MASFVVLAALAAVTPLHAQTEAQVRNELLANFPNPDLCSVNQHIDRGELQTCARIVAEATGYHPGWSPERCEAIVDDLRKECDAIYKVGSEAIPKTLEEKLKGINRQRFDVCMERNFGANRHGESPEDFCVSWAGNR